MTDILNKNYCLVLNNIWQPIGFVSIKKAIVAMYSTQDGENMAAQALDLDYEKDENGFVNFTSPNIMIPTGIPEWNSLPIRDFDIPIHTSKTIIRAPIVLIARNFSKMIFRKLRPTKRNLFDFYKGKCIWTGRTLSFNEMTIEHMIPKSHKGQETWQNLAPADKDINNKRGNIPLDKFELKPQYKLKEPKSTPVSVLINKAVRPEWEYFLLSK